MNSTNTPQDWSPALLNMGHALGLEGKSLQDMLRGVARAKGIRSKEQAGKDAKMKGHDD